MIYFIPILLLILTAFIRGPVKVIKSKDGHLHFKRYSILNFGIFRIYIHFIYKSDLDEHLHSHPWSFLNIVLFGKYIEQLSDKKRLKYPLFISYCGRNIFHKIDKLLSKKVVTLNFMFGKWKPWFYKVDDTTIGFEDYRILKRSKKLL